MFLFQISIGKEAIGTEMGVIYIEAGGKTPQQADPNQWLVFIADSQPINIKRKYNNHHDASSGDGFWAEDPTFKVQVSSFNY